MKALPLPTYSMAIWLPGPHVTTAHVSDYSIKFKINTYLELRHNGKDSNINVLKVSGIHLPLSGFKILFAAFLKEIFQ